MLKIISLFTIFLTLNSYAGSPEKDSKVRNLRTQFANGSAIEFKNIVTSENWKCTHYNAFKNDAWVEKVVTMSLRGAGPYIYNTGNFVVKSLRNTSEGLVGRVAIPEYAYSVLFSAFRQSPDGIHLVGETSINTETLVTLGDYYNKGVVFSGPQSVMDPSKTVFYYTKCKRLE